MPGNLPGGGSRTALPADRLPSHWQHARVLVVDDHRTYRMLLGALLDKLGIANQAVGDGEAALEALATGVFDLVISDCRMPVMNGYAMTQHLRRREREAGTPHLPVIALTGRLAPDDVRRCLACGMDGWLIKPIGLAQLHELLLYWLAKPPPRSGAEALSPAPAPVKRPTRASLIATFGSWDVVEPLLFSLIQEAYEDLAGLAQAEAGLDATLTNQRLHRLVGSVAFLGATDLEPQAVCLIDRVSQAGVAGSAAALAVFRQDLERYLQYLSNL